MFLPSSNRSTHGIKEVTCYRVFKIYSVNKFVNLSGVFQCYIKRNFKHFLNEKELLLVRKSSKTNKTQ